MGGNLAFAAILTGHTPPDRAVDHLGDDSTTAYHRAAEALLAAFAQPAILDTVVTVPIGAVPGIVALHLRITECLVVLSWPHCARTSPRSRGRCWGTVAAMMAAAAH